ncbi:hypothetical protein HY734_00210 [Candidatus Uhrbacteria bacterium]|nr:hypothetical protein [Candidatus Uhrbacteria bacterium]
MPNVILTKGLPGSGKSIWAKEAVRRRFDAVKRVSMNGPAGSDCCRLSVLADGYRQFSQEVRSTQASRPAG